MCSSRVGGAENDFDRQFRSFAARKNVTLAPINRFRKSQGATPEVIVLDGNGDVQMGEQATTSGPTRTAKHLPFPSDHKGNRHRSYIGPSWSMDVGCILINVFSRQLPYVTSYPSFRPHNDSDLLCIQPYLLIVAPSPCPHLYEEQRLHRSRTTPQPNTFSSRDPISPFGS